MSVGQKAQTTIYCFPFLLVICVNIIVLFLTAYSSSCVCVCNACRRGPQATTSWIAPFHRAWRILCTSNRSNLVSHFAWVTSSVIIGSISFGRDTFSFRSLSRTNRQKLSDLSVVVVFGRARSFRSHFLCHFVTHVLDQT